MATGNTTLLGLALPVEGELDGTWGDVVNDSITSLVDSAIAGTTTLSADADVTLTTTNLAANQARQAVLLWTASNGATTRNITAPARSKPYIVINAGTGSVVLRGAGPTTGITIAAGEKCVAAWNGSDFVRITPSTDNGTYTPTIANVSNVDISGSTASTFQFLRVGSTVTVSGKIAIALTSTGICRLNISLPVASTFTSSEQCAGFGEALASGGLPPPSLRGIVIASGTNAEFQWYSGVTGAAQDYYFHFTYRVV